MRRLLKFLAWVAALQAVSYLLLRLLKSRSPSNPDPAGDEFDLAVIGEAGEFRSTAAALRRATARVICGALYLDLRGATLAPGGARLDLHTTLGATEVVVPPEWRVVLRGIAVAGSNTSGATPGAGLPAGAPTLVVDARTRFGAVHVRAATPPAGREGGR